MVYDIETELITEQPKESLKVICGVVFDIDKNKFFQFKNADRMCKYLNKASCLIGYNNQYFDDRVLMKHGLNKKIERIDLFQHCKKNCGSKRIKWPRLEELMKSNFDVMKTKYNRENLKELIKHCKEDVEYTFKLFQLLKDEGFKMPENTKITQRYFGEDTYLDEAWNDFVPQKIVDYPCPSCKEMTKAHYIRISIHHDSVDGSEFEDMSEGQMADYFGAMMVGDTSSEWYHDAFMGVCDKCNKSFDDREYN